MIKVLIADHQEIVRHGLKVLLSRCSEIKVVAITNSIYETLGKIRAKEPDVVVVDFDPIDISNNKATEYFSKNFPNIKVIIHNSNIDKKIIADGFRAGASAYVAKTNSVEYLKDAIKVVIKGEKYIGTNVANFFVNNLINELINGNEEMINGVELEKPEREIIGYICDGLSNGEIAKKFNIQLRAVSKRKHKIMKKLQIGNTADLIKFALINNIKSN